MCVPESTGRCVSQPVWCACVCECGSVTGGAEAWIERHLEGRRKLRSDSLLLSCAAVFVRREKPLAPDVSFTLFSLSASRFLLPPGLP